MAREVVQMHGLEGVLDTLKRLPPEIVSRRGGPVKNALRRAALVLRKEAQANVQKIIDTPNKGGMPTESVGLLKKNIVASRDPRPWQSGANERYLVRVKRAKYPSDRGEKVSTGKVGALLEMGTERREPMPWMRPAYLTKRGEALQEFVRVIRTDIEKIVKKLAKGAR